MNTTIDHASSPTRSDRQEIAEAFLRVGAAWARYGLSVARASVETSARTLNVTASALGTLAERFHELEGDDTHETEGEARSE
ncbi:MAG: hypothetical protein U0263_02735 [Polyangiaceae bacterium]